MAKYKHKDEILRTWSGLNAHLANADEAECQRLLKLELKGAKRTVVALRIHSRLNLVRAQTERYDIIASTTAV